MEQLKNVQTYLRKRMENINTIIEPHIGMDGDIPDWIKELISERRIVAKMIMEINDVRVKYENTND